MYSFLQKGLPGYDEMETRGPSGAWASARHSYNLVD